MTIAILATGDEIVHGDTLNTNGQNIAKYLSSEGLPIGHHVSCSDKEKDLLEAIAFLAKDHDTIISIGGLGPTTDDCTRFAFAQYFQLELVEFSEALQHINQRLNRAGLSFDAGNRQQALFPKNSILLPNPNGTAMGCMFRAKSTLSHPFDYRTAQELNPRVLPAGPVSPETPSPHLHKGREPENDERCIILLPGPPRECLPMFKHFVLPELQKTHHSDKHLLIWQLFGVAEGQVSEILEGALKNIDCRTGYRLDMPYLEFKVKCAGSLTQTIKEIIDPLVVDYIICPPREKASRILREKLKTMSVKSFIGDRATGGVLETLIRRPENKETCTFDFNGKASETIQFEIDGLDAYWNSKESTTDQLKIRYVIHQNNGEEIHTIPFRGHSGVLSYAAEWLSFRISHLIDELH